jgi:hypothetical protein
MAALRERAGGVREAAGTSCVEGPAHFEATRRSRASAGVKFREDTYARLDE